MSEVIVTQADIARAEEISGILDHHWSEYEGDATADLAAEFARHRTEALEAAAKHLEYIGDRSDSEMRSYAYGFAQDIRALTATEAKP